MSTSSPVGRSHRGGAMGGGARHTAAHWNSSLAKSPQLRADLAHAGVDVDALAAYALAARSRHVPLSQLTNFLDPKPRGATLLAQTQTTESDDASVQGGDWNPSTALDWKELNGTREVTLLLSETALLHPEAHALAQARQADEATRRTDVRTGHRLDHVIPTKKRFEQDAYYARIVDLRKSQEGKAPSQRLPPPKLYNGFIMETEPKDEHQRQVVEAHNRAKQARTDHLHVRTRHQWGMAADPSIKNPAEFSNTQTKKQSINACPAAADNTYNRLFHLDLPPPEPGQFLAKRSPAALAREQNIRDKTVHGREYDPISNARIQTIPPSEQAQMQFKLSGPNAMGRYRQDLKQQSAMAQVSGDV